MSLAGSLATMPLVELLEWLDSKRKTGTLVLEGAEATTTLSLRDGRVLTSSSTDPRHYFGQYLLAQTRISEEQLRRAFERQEKTRVHLGHNLYVKTLLGKILVEEGLLGEDEVTEVLRRKAEETIYDVFLWTEGSFTFRPAEFPPEEMVPISLDIKGVIDRGLARARAFAEIRKRIPSRGATFRAGPRRLPPDARLDPFATRVLAELLAGRSLRDTTLTLHATEFNIHWVISELLSARLIVLDRTQDPAPTAPLEQEAGGAPPDELVERGLQLLDQRAYEDTVVTARQALREDPTHHAARRLLERSEHELTANFYAHRFAPADVPRLNPTAPPIDPRALSPEERFLLERVNGEWSVTLIVKLSPLREVDTLATLKRLLERGVIEIQRPDASGSTRALAE